MATGIVVAVAGFGFAFVPQVKSWWTAGFFWFVALGILVHAFRYEIGSYFTRRGNWKEPPPPPEIKRVQIHEGVSIARLAVHNMGGPASFSARARVIAVSQTQSPFRDSNYDLLWGHRRRQSADIQKHGVGEIIVAETWNESFPRHSSMVYLGLIGAPADSPSRRPNVVQEWRWSLAPNEGAWATIAVTIVADPELVSGTWEGVFKVRGDSYGRTFLKKVDRDT